MQLELINSIEKMTVNGNRLELPSNEQLTNYASVKKALISAGGKYKQCGFIFSGCAQKIKDRFVGGEVVNDKKKYQFYPTSLHIVNLILKKANITKGMRVLEPSAGQGAIVDEIIKAGVNPDMVELMPDNIKILNQKYNTDLVSTDFLKINPCDSIKYDRVIANPPFTNNQDIDHVLHMHDFLTEGGTLISIMSKSWITGQQKKQKSFRDWLTSVGAIVTDLPAGEFKESGTNIATVIIEIKR
jgi:phospholipid N-methyltransferase